MANAASLITPNNSVAMMQASQERSTQALRNLKDAQEAKKVDDAAKQFEAVFVTEMMKPMFEGISSDGMFGGGRGEEVFKGMLVQEYGKLMADNGGIGLSAPIREQMIKMQEQADHAPQAQTNQE